MREFYSDFLVMQEVYFNDSTFEADYVKIQASQWETLLDQLSRAA
jgi:hypothetical protein